MQPPLYATLSAPGLEPVTFHGTARPQENGCYLDGDNWIAGWYSTPDLKTGVSERGQGDGAHDIPARDIAYAARTVTLRYRITATGRTSLLSLLDHVGAYAHRLARLRVVDGTQDTWCEGILQNSADGAWHDRLLTGGEFTLVCPRPERLSTDTHEARIMSPGGEQGGLDFGGNGTGLAFPLDFGDNNMRSACVLSNNGTSAAYPVYTLVGPWPDGVELLCTGGRSIRLDMNVGDVPVTLDTRSGTATLGGRDISRHLSKRSWATIPAHGSLAVSVLSRGGGYVVCESHDTWM